MAPGRLGAGCRPRALRRVARGPCPQGERPGFRGQKLTQGQRLTRGTRGRVETYKDTLLAGHNPPPPPPLPTPSGRCQYGARACAERPETRKSRERGLRWRRGRELGPCGWGRGRAGRRGPDRRKRGRREFPSLSPAPCLQCDRGFQFREIRRRPGTCAERRREPLGAPLPGGRSPSGRRGRGAGWGGSARGVAGPGRTRPSCRLPRSL